MQRRIMIQLTAPAVIIGLVLFTACLLSAWYINRLQAGMSNILAKNVRSLQAAAQLEVSLRQLRFSLFLNTLAPDPQLLSEIRAQDETFEHWLRIASSSAQTDEEAALVRSIQVGYDRYREEVAREDWTIAALLVSAAAQRIAEGTLHSTPAPSWSGIVGGLGPLPAGTRPASRLVRTRDFQKLAGAHPIRHVVEPCRELLQVNEQMMLDSIQESERVTGMVRVTLVFLGVVGPISGLIAGYGIARGLSRSIYELRIRLQDITQRLDHQIGTVSVSGADDAQGLEAQLQQIVRRVEEVAERMQTQRREMIRAQQLSAAGQLAASIAHEVRNPLTSIKILVQAALLSQNRRPLSLEDLQVIHGEIARLEEIVREFLDFARPPRPQREPSDLRDILGQARELIRPRARQQHVELCFTMPEEPVRSLVDRSQLRTVLVNLLMNALDAMPNGGRLEVELEVTPAGGARLDIRDTGTGISPEVGSDLFTPFVSTKPTGTGLGLAISRRIVEEHGGEIVGANRASGGASFLLRLPPFEFGEKRHADTANH